MKAQKGAALLIVLMILALMAALAAEMTVSFQTQLQRSRRTSDFIRKRSVLSVVVRIILQKRGSRAAVHVAGLKARR
jgi:type II secretory pathway component PulK